MGIRTRVALLFAVLIIFISVSSSAFGSEGGGRFDNLGALQGWRIKRGNIEVKGGSLNIKEGSFPIIYSPERLGVPTSVNTLRFRMKSSKAGVATLSLFSARTKYSYKLDFAVYASHEYRDYNLYLGYILPPAERIYDFAIKLPGNKLSVSMDSIGFYRLTRYGLARLFWNAFWAPARITVGSSNFITSPAFGLTSFVTILYGLVVLLTLLIFAVISVKSRSITRGAFMRAVLSAFVVCALFFTFRMDFNWLKLWQIDRASLTGLDLAGRVRAINNGNYDSYFDMIDTMKAILPKGAKIRPVGRVVNDYNDHVARNISYNMLPVLSAPGAEYMWRYFDQGDMGITYDVRKKALYRHSKLLESNVEVVKEFPGEAVLYRIIKDGRSGYN